MKNKLVSMLTVTALMFGLLTACGSGNKEEAGANDPGSSPSNSSQIELTMLTNSATPEKFAGTDIVTKVEEKFNVKIKFIQTPQGTPDDIRKAINLKIASGEILDVFPANMNFTDYQTYIDQDVIAEVSLDMIKQHAPDIYGHFNRTIGEDGWKQLERNGKSYTLPAVWSIAKNFNALAVREDWMQEVGITKLPETIDDMEQFFKLVKEKKNTYAYSGAWSSNNFMHFSWVFGAFGSTPMIFTENDGKIVRGEIEPGAKQALIVLNRWYTEGYLDPEFAINKEANVREKWVAEKFGVVSQGFYHLIPSKAFWGGFYYDNLEKVNPNGKLTVILPPKGSEGEQSSRQDHPITNAGVLFGKHLEKQPEKLEKYLQVMNYLMTPEGQDLSNFGIEDKTYNKSDEDGYTFIPPYDTPEEREKVGMNSFMTTTFNDYEHQALFAPKEFRTAREESQKLAIGKNNPLNASYLPVFVEKRDQLEKFVIQNYIQFITGEKSLEQFDTFVKEYLEQQGGKQVLEEAQKVFDSIK